MTIKSISTGLHLAARRPGLILLVYLVNMLAALVISIPVFAALGAATANTGFGPDLVERFDFVVWADIVEAAGDALLASWVQFLWVIPLVLVWKIAMSVGLIHSLRDGGIRSFWEGVGRYTGKATLIALMYILLIIAWLVVVGILVGVGTIVLSTTPQTFVLYWILMPSAVLLGLALMDAMHDYSRIILVSKGRGVGAAWFEGMKYPFRHPGAISIYLFWVVAVTVLSAVAIRLHASWASAIAGVWLLFLGQQVVFFLRSGATVAWFGSEVSFFERLDFRDAPLIADSPGDTEVATPHVV